MFTIVPKKKEFRPVEFTIKITDKDLIEELVTMSTWLKERSKQDLEATDYPDFDTGLLVSTDKLFTAICHEAHKQCS